MIPTIIFLLGLFMGILMSNRFSVIKEKQNKELLKNMRELENRWKNKYTDDGYEAY